MEYPNWMLADLRAMGVQMHDPAPPSPAMVEDTQPPTCPIPIEDAPPLSQDSMYAETIKRGYAADGENNTERDSDDGEDGPKARGPHLTPRLLG